MEYGLRRQTDVGIEVKALFPGEVPDFELREARIFGMYSWSDWIELDWQEKALAVAHYRLHRLIEAHINDAQQSETARRTARAKRRGAR